jgi:Flp pilus assembly protein TadG
MKMLSRSTRRQRGAAAVEFAIVAPLLFMILLGIVDVGNMLFVYNSMLNAARETSRSVAVSADTPAQGKSKAEAALNKHYGKKGKTTFTVVVTVPANSSEHEVKTTISTPLSETMMLDVFKLLGEFNLTASASIRKEV